VIALTETRLSPSNSDLYQLPNYNSFHATRTDRRGGEVALYIQDSIDFRRRTDLVAFTDDIESLFIEIPSLRESQTIIVGVIYRTPNTNHQNCFTCIEHITQTIRREKKLSYILGDFNIDISLYPDGRLVLEFLDQVYFEGYIPLINSTTRYDLNM
jgi:hypothetical protein